MNISSDQVRENLKVFDGKYFWQKISKKAQLCDTGYFIPKLENLKEKVVLARIEMARILDVSIHDLHLVHTGINGRYDCDNYAKMGCAIVHALHDRECRKIGSNAMQFAIFTMARADKNHTQAICLTQEGWYIVEFINGEIKHWKEIKNLKLMLVG